MIPLPPAPPGAFCAPAGRRDPGRSPAALRAASADFRPLRRASRPSGLRPASPHPLQAGPPCGPSPCTIPFLTPPQKNLRRITTIRRRNYFLFGYGIPAKILSNGP